MCPLFLRLRQELAEVEEEEEEELLVDLREEQLDSEEAGESGMTFIGGEFVAEDEFVEEGEEEDLGTSKTS